jgi:hypothetical protein
VRDGFCTKLKLKECFKDLAASRRISKKGWWSWVVVLLCLTGSVERVGSLQMFLLSLLDGGFGISFY